MSYLVSTAFIFALLNSTTLYAEYTYRFNCKYIAKDGTQNVQRMASIEIRQEHISVDGKTSRGAITYSSWSNESFRWNLLNKKNYHFNLSWNKSFSSDEEALKNNNISAISFTSPKESWKIAFDFVNNPFNSSPLSTLKIFREENFGLTSNTYLNDQQFDCFYFIITGSRPGMTGSN